jgi:hypothetical protein
VASNVNGVDVPANDPGDPGRLFGSFMMP